jgi:UDP-glucose 4-epimerase
MRSDLAMKSDDDNEISSAVVTGGAGFIGSYIVDELLEKGIQVFVIDDLSTGSMGNLDKHSGDRMLHVIPSDVSKLGELIPKSQVIDCIFHEAAIASVPMSVKFPLKVHEANVNKSLDVLEFCVKRDVKKILFASSAAVYGLDEDLTASEDLVCRPTSPYGASKISVEHYLRAYSATYGLEGVALRYFNVYGPRQRTSNEYSGVITKFISKLLDGNSPTIYGDGRQTRDFVNVRDIAKANILAMETPGLNFEIFNVATGTTTDILGLLSILKNLTKSWQITPNFAPPRPGDGRFGAASIDKIRTVLGYHPRVSLEEGLAELVDYMRVSREIESSVEVRDGGVSAYAN